MNAVLMVSTGGALGCLLRWMLGLSLNAVFPVLPLGTLAANLLAAYLVGIAIAFFMLVPMPVLMSASMLNSWRLFIITGFLGGLSTFSSFSAEVILSIQAGRFLWAGIMVIANLIGSLFLTFLGMVTVSFLRSLIHAV